MSGVLWKYFRETLRFPLIWRPGPLATLAEGGADVLDDVRDGLRWLLDQYIPEKCDEQFIETHAVGRAVRRWYAGSSPSLRQLAADSYMIYRMGGRAAGLERVLGWLGVEALIVEAHQQSPPLPPFFFDVVLEHYPASVDDLMRAVMAFKPARSWISSIRQPDCLPRMVLDYSRLDEAILSDVAGWMDGNIKWCFFEDRSDRILVESPGIRQARGRTKTLHCVPIWADMLDYMVLDEPETILNPVTERTSVRGWGADYPAPVHDTYPWRTFACQQVLSDYGALSGGEGFIDYYWREPDECQWVLDETLVLSDQVPRVKTPIIEFFWREADAWRVDATVEPPAAAIRRRERSSRFILADPAVGSAHAAIHANRAILPRIWTGDWTAGAWDSAFTVAAETKHLREETT